MKDMPEPQSAQQERRHHQYVSNRIPWFVHVMWLFFWIFAIAYTLMYLFPAIREQFAQP